MASIFDDLDYDNLPPTAPLTSPPKRETRSSTNNVNSNARGEKKAIANSCSDDASVGTTTTTRKKLQKRSEIIVEKRPTPVVVAASVMPPPTKSSNSSSSISGFFANCSCTFDGKLVPARTAPTSSGFPYYSSPVFVVLPFGNSMGYSAAKLVEEIIEKNGGILERDFVFGCNNNNTGSQFSSLFSCPIYFLQQLLFGDRSAGLVIVSGLNSVEDLVHLNDSNVKHNYFSQLMSSDDKKNNSNSTLCGEERHLLSKVVSFFQSMVTASNSLRRKLVCVRPDWIGKCNSKQKLLVNVDERYLALKITNPVVAVSANNNIITYDDDDDDINIVHNNNSSLTLEKQNVALSDNDSQNQLPYIEYKRKKLDSILSNFCSFFRDDDDGNESQTNSNKSFFESASPCSKTEDGATSAKTKTDSRQREQRNVLLQMFGQDVLRAAKLTFAIGEDHPARSHFAEVEEEEEEFRNDEKRRKDDDGKNNVNGHDEDCEDEDVSKYKYDQHDTDEDDDVSTFRNNNRRRHSSDDFEPEPQQPHRAANNMEVSTKTAAVKMTNYSHGHATMLERKPDGENQEIVNHLRSLSALHNSYQTDPATDVHRARMYKRAAILIEKLPFKITSSAQLQNIRGIGAKIAMKIDEILAKGTSVKYETMMANPLFIAAKALTKIWGVGQATAKVLMNKFQVLSIDQLRNNLAAFNSLNPNQKLGLKYYEDLDERMPRSEVVMIQSIVAKTLAGLGYTTNVESPKLCLASTYDKSSSSSSVVSKSVARNCAVDPSTGKMIYNRGNIDLVTCGSYRRGQEDSGDVDILICDRSNQGIEAFIVTSLTEELAKFCGHTEFQRNSTSRSRAASSFTFSSLPSAAATTTCGHGSLSFPSSSTSSSMSMSMPRTNSFMISNTNNNFAQQKNIQQQQLLPELPSRFEVFEKLVAGSSSWRAVGDTEHNQTFMGIVRVEQCRDPTRCPCAHKADGTHFARRIDVKSYKTEQFPFALLYFTGSSLLNRSMRLFADTMGFRLSDKELVSVRRIGGIVHETRCSFSCSTEEEIFSYLGLKYLEPHQRSFEFIDVQRTTKF